MRTNRARIATVFFAALLGLAVTASAQTVPNPRADVLMNDPVNSEWLQTYPSDAPAPLPGTPFITELRLTLTPTAGGGTRVVTIPRAQVARVTSAALCPGGPTPCLRADDIPIPVGAFNITATFVSGAGAVGGASTPVPFTGSFPAPAAAGLRSLVPRP